MPKLTWNKHIVTDVRRWSADVSLVPAIVRQSVKDGPFKWEVSHISGSSETLEGAQDKAEEVLTREALKLLKALGLDYKARIDKALGEALQHSQCDGSHHKAWSIDQIVRALTGCPMVTEEAKDYHGTPYTYERQGESEEYLAFVRVAKDADENGEEQYSWDEGCPP
jgi:hypothetical protein